MAHQSLSPGVPPRHVLRENLDGGGNQRRGPCTEYCLAFRWGTSRLHCTISHTVHSTPEQNKHPQHTDTNKPLLVGFLSVWRGKCEKLTEIYNDDEKAIASQGLVLARPQGLTWAQHPRPNEPS
jgi:hypothetical protein